MSQRPHIPELDGWRGFAILLVLLGHFFPADDVIRLGRMGVDVFFVLSGRLMADILFEQRMPLKTFFIRRASRIYPALAVYVLLGTLIFMHSFIPIPTRNIIGALTFTVNYFGSWGHRGLFDNVWTLSVEEHSYLLLGLMAFIHRRYGWNILLLLPPIWLAAMANGYYRHHELGHSYIATYWRTDVMLAAILMPAWLYLFLNRNNMRLPGWLAVLALVPVWYIKSESIHASYAQTLGTALLALALMAQPQWPRPLSRLFCFTPLRLLGLWSYSIYLWQQPFYQYAKHGYYDATLLCAAGILCGIISYYFVEQPARRYLNARYGQAATPAPSACGAP